MLWSVASENNNLTPLFFDPFCPEGLLNFDWTMRYTEWTMGYTDEWTMGYYIKWTMWYTWVNYGIYIYNEWTMKYTEWTMG